MQISRAIHWAARFTRRSSSLSSAVCVGQGSMCLLFNNHTTLRLALRLFCTVQRNVMVEAGRRKIRSRAGWGEIFHLPVGSVYPERASYITVQAISMLTIPYSDEHIMSSPGSQNLIAPLRILGFDIETDVPPDLTFPTFDHYSVFTIENTVATYGMTPHVDTFISEFERIIQVKPNQVSKLYLLLVPVLPLMGRRWFLLQMRPTCCLHGRILSSRLILTLFLDTTWHAVSFGSAHSTWSNRIPIPWEA